MRGPVWLISSTATFLIYIRHCEVSIPLGSGKLRLKMDFKNQENIVTNDLAHYAEAKNKF